MNLAVVYPGLLFHDGEQYTSDSYQHRSLLALTHHFGEVTLLASVQRAPSRKGRYSVDARQLRIHPLPGFRNAYELYGWKFPFIVFGLLRAFATQRKRWHVVLLFEPTPINQVALLLCYLFRKPAVVRMAGRLDANLWKSVRHKGLLKRVAGWLLSKEVWWAEFVMACFAPIITSGDMDFIPKFARNRRFRNGGPRVSFCADGIPDNWVLAEIQAQRPLLRHGRLHVLSAHRAHHEKGLEHLIEAIGILRKRGIDATADILRPLYTDTYGPSQHALQRRVQELGLENAVRFLLLLASGPEPLDVCAHVDALVVLPLDTTEGVPKVLLEAMARGIPVVASHVGVIPAVVRHRENGLVVPPNNPLALANTLRELASDTALRERLVRTALSDVTHYTEGACVKRMAAFVKEAAAGGHRLAAGESNLVQ